MAQYWLYKTEPSTYSFERLQKEKSTNWNLIRNYQARNFLKQAKVGDLVVVYHSGDVKAAVGLGKIIREAYPDVDPDDPKTEWVQVDIQYISHFKAPVSLGAIKADPTLKNMLLVKQSRLSAMPIEKDHYEKLVRLGNG